MKNKYYKKTISFFAIFLLLNIVFCFFVFPNLAKAEANWKLPELQIKIPGMADFSKPVECGTNPITNTTQYCIPWIGEYIAGIYKYAIGIVGIIAAIMLMVGGIRWLTAGGNASAVGEAKNIIVASLSGLILALCSWMVLYYINPQLVNLPPLKVAVVEKKEEEISSQTCELKSLGSKSKKEVCGDATPTNVKDCITIMGEKEYNAAKLKVTGISAIQCCCTSYGTTEDYFYDSGIKQQLSDASPQLLNLLSCMRPMLPKSVGKISSISDSNYINNPAGCDIRSCAPNCQHSCQSCHYGGGTGINQSYAVDFGDEGNADIIESAARACDSGAFILLEGDHLHISVSACPKN